MEKRKKEKERKGKERKGKEEEEEEKRNRTIVGPRRRLLLFSSPLLSPDDATSCFLLGFKSPLPFPLLLLFLLLFLLLLPAQQLVLYDVFGVW